GLAARPRRTWSQSHADRRGAGPEPCGTLQKAEAVGSDEYVSTRGMSSASKQAKHGLLMEKFEAGNRLNPNVLSWVLKISFGFRASNFRLVAGCIYGRG